MGLLLVLLLTSKGGAGVSGSAIAVLALTLTATKSIPVNSIALVLGIHRILSAMFVFINIVGNCVTTLVVAKWEKAIDTTVLKAELNAGGASRPSRNHHLAPDTAEQSPRSARPVPDAVDDAPRRPF